MEQINTTDVLQSPIGALFRACGANGDGTPLTPEYMNGLMMEMINVINKSCQTPIPFDVSNPASYNQLWTAITRFGGSCGIPAWEKGISNNIVMGSDCQFYLANKDGDPPNNNPVGDSANDHWYGPFCSIGALQEQVILNCCVSEPDCIVSNICYLLPDGGNKYQEVSFKFDPSTAVALSSKDGYIIGVDSSGDSIRADINIVGGHVLGTVGPGGGWPDPWASSPISVRNHKAQSVITWTFDRDIRGTLQMSMFDIDSDDVISGWNIPPDSITATGDLIEATATWNNFSGNQISFKWENKIESSSNYSFNGDLFISVEPLPERGTKCVSGDGEVMWVKDKDGNLLSESDIVDELC